MRLLLTEGLHGFAWGPVEVRRVFEHEGRVCLEVITDTGKAISIYVSRTGRSVRVFGDGVEWKPQKAGSDE